MTKLIALRRSTNDEVLPIHKRLTFGRDASCCESVLTHPSAARRHFQVFVERGQAFVSDLSGPRGTFVNNSRVAEDAPHPIRNGDRLLYGESQNEFFYVAEINGGNEKIDKLTKKLEWLVTECERIRIKEGADGLSANQQRTLDRYQEDIADIGKSLGTLLSAILGETPETGGESSVAEDAFWDGGVPEDNGIESSYLDLTEKKAKASKSVETYDSLVKKLNDLDAERLTLEQEIKKLTETTNQTADDDEDELDKFMAANEKHIQTSDLEKAEKRLAEVLEERKRTQALVNIAQPALARMAQPVVNNDISAKPQSVRSMSDVSANSKESEIKITEMNKSIAPTSKASSLFSRGAANSKPASAAFRIVQNPLDKRAKVEFSDELAGESEQLKVDAEESESTWIPPSNQQGDGRTKSNFKYGY